MRSLIFNQNHEEKKTTKYSPMSVTSLGEMVSEKKSNIGRNPHGKWPTPPRSSCQGKGLLQRYISPCDVSRVTCPHQQIVMTWRFLVSQEIVHYRASHTGISQNMCLGEWRLSDIKTICISNACVALSSFGRGKYYIICQIPSSTYWSIGLTIYFICDVIL